MPYNLFHGTVIDERSLLLHKTEEVSWGIPQGKGGQEGEPC